MHVVSPAKQGVGHGIGLKVNCRVQSLLSRLVVSQRISWSSLTYVNKLFHHQAGHGL